MDFKGFNPDQFLDALLFKRAAYQSNKDLAKILIDIREKQAAALDTAIQYLIEQLEIDINTLTEKWVIEQRMTNPEFMTEYDFESGNHKIYWKPPYELCLRKKTPAELKHDSEGS